MPCVEFGFFSLPPEEHPFGGALATQAFKAGGESHVVYIYLWMEVETESGRAPVDFLTLCLRAWWVRMASAFRLMENDITAAWKAENSVHGFFTC